MFSAELIQLFREGQRYFSDRVFSDLQAIGQTHSVAAYVGLILIGFVYGTLHAIGPGHGKVVVSSYVLATENSLKRGISVVLLSSFMQAVVAIVGVGGLYKLFGLTRLQTERSVGWLETASYVLVCLVGVYYLWLALGKMRKMPKRSPALDHQAHTHGAGCSCCGCGHAHAPTLDEVTKANDTATFATMVVSIGMRPCTGALMLLFFSFAAGLVVPGTLAVFAMAAGTALTTGSLAVLAVKSRGLAFALTDKSERALWFVESGLRVLGGVALITMGALFLYAQGLSQPVTTAEHPLFKSLR